MNEPGDYLINETTRWFWFIDGSFPAYRTDRKPFESQSKPGQMKVSKGRSQPEIAADMRLLVNFFKRGSGITTILIPAF